MKRRTVRRLLDHRACRVGSIEPGRPVREAVHRLFEERVGTLVVYGVDGIAGIVTWHEVLPLLNGGAPELDGAIVAEVMCRPALTASPDIEVDTLVALMAERGVRHVPVVEGETVLCVLSLVDARAMAA